MNHATEMELHAQLHQAEGERDVAVEQASELSEHLAERTSAGLEDNREILILIERVQELEAALRRILQDPCDPEITAVEAIREFERIARAALATTEPRVCHWSCADPAVWETSCGMSLSHFPDTPIPGMCGWCRRKVEVTE